jgi:hypothetical protein
MSAYGRLPLVFEPARRGGAFLARGEGALVGLDARGAVFALRGEGQRSALVRMELAGARPDARLAGKHRLPGVVNEFAGGDRSRWRTNVPTFARLSARDVYPGIELAYHGRQGVLEYDFLLAPGADPAAVALRFRGHRGMRLDRAGDLLLSLPGGVLRQHRPVAYQLFGGERRRVAARFSLHAHHLVGFALGRYDHSRPLVIDPSVPYSTYLGANSDDSGLGIAVDSSGNVYLTGSTLSTNFQTANPFQLVSGGGTDAFVVKLNAAGSALVYSSYLGGGGEDIGRSIAVNSLGSAYLSGSTFSTNFPTANAVQTTYGGNGDAFVARLNAAGSALTYSSYVGGSGDDSSRSIGIDSSGNAYLTGRTSSTDFPTANAIQTTKQGTFDAFVTKLNAAGNAYVYSTYLGGSAEDQGYAIAVDPSGNSYLTGLAFSADFPTVNPIQATYGGSGDAFVTKLNAAGSAIDYSTFLGGNDAETGNGIAVDSTGAAYLTGFTNSADFPTANPVQAASGGSTDAFVTKLNAAGSALVYSSYLGGNGLADTGLAIAVGSSGNAYLTGKTDSSDFPVVTPFQPSNGGGPTDAFVVQLNAAGSAFTYSSYLGGGDGDIGRAIAVDASGNAYVTGETGSTNFPTTSAFQSAKGSGDDAFVIKVAAPTTAVALRSFTATRSGRDVLLRWRTASETQLAGFALYRGARKLTGAPIPAGQLGGRAYSFRDRLPAGAHGLRYWLEALHLDGTSIRYGPVSIS